MTSEVYKLRKVDEEKRKRINSFKMKLEEVGDATRKDEKIQSLEDKYVLPFNLLVFPAFLLAVFDDVQ